MSCLQCSRLCSRSWRDSSELDTPGPCPPGASIVAGEVRWGWAMKHRAGWGMEGTWTEGRTLWTGGQGAVGVVPELETE